MQILRDGKVHMANLCVVGGHYVNGVSKLHSQIIKDDVFHEFYRLMPEKFGNVTNGIAHARLLAQKSCHVCVPGGLLRPRTEAIIGAAAITALQQFNFTKAFIGANGVALNVGFTTPDPEEAAVKAVAVRRARETWYLVDDSKFGRVYPAVIGEIYSGAILTNRCPDPKYRQLTLVKETEQ